MPISRRLLLPLIAAATTAACGGSSSDSASNPTNPGSGNGGVTPPPGKDSTEPGTLVVVFQRFAADWINLLVPAGDSAYAGLRPNLAVANPLALDGYFGLNPALGDLQHLYQTGDLGFVTATGWIPTDSRDRSHFFAQSLAESGARSGVTGGWLGRVMTRDAGHNEALWSAIAAETSVPASLQGFANAVAVRDFADFNHGSIAGASATALLETLSTIAGDPGFTTLRLAQAMSTLADEPPTVSEVVYPTTTLGQGLKVAAQAIRAGYAPRVVTVTSDDDWDTHVNQASRHAASLPRFAGALRAFHDDLGELMQNVTLVTMTEFGRKARENFGGTDHGTASSMIVMGKRVAGAQVYGQWPGLHASALYQGEDLEPTTDFRAVLGELLVRHSGISESLLDEIFPGGYAQRQNWRNFTLAS
jgi:uncharacterized protein (DUF1501 family)